MIAALALWGCAAPSASPTTWTVGGETMGTTWSIKWITTDDRSEEVLAAARDALADVDAKMSTWRDDSELSQVAAEDRPVVVSEETAAISVVMRAELKHDLDASRLRVLLREVLSGERRDLEEATADSEEPGGEEAAAQGAEAPGTQAEPDRAARQAS